MWPVELRRELSSAAREQVAAELVRHRELVRVLDALTTRGVCPLILKGAALAHTVYDEPSTRQRGDSDLLIRPEDRTTVATTLALLGYEPLTSAGGELATYQQTYEGRHHRVDVHWKLSNAQLFAAGLTYEELNARAIPVPALGAHARALCPPDALLHALLHRVTHINAPYYVDGVAYLEHNRLIWLYDIHLLSQRLSAEEWDEVVAHAHRHQWSAICLDGLVATREAFGTKLPLDVVNALGGTQGREPSAAYLRRGRALHTLTELRALPTWPQRLRLMKDLLLPHPDYMLDKYGTSSRVALPWLYVKRAVGGVYKLVKPPTS